MKKFKRSLALTLALGSFVTLLPKNVNAQNVNANLPGFNVRLNDEKVDYKKSQYPLLVYKDITYFPMTYDNTRFLGVETNWNDKDRKLVINNTGFTDWHYNNYNKNEENAKTYPVSVPTFKINVNGKEIDNSKEQYPLLIFRDVTYFPMTWRFCVDEFGWEYKFSEKDGLVISSVNSKKEEAKKEEAKKEKPKEETWKDYSKTIFYNGYYYVVKEKDGKHRLFKDSLIGDESTKLSDIEITDFKQEDNKLFFFSDNDPYYYDLKKGKVEKLLKNADVKDGQIITIDDEVYWVSEEDGELYNKDKEKINKGNKVENISKEDEYLIVNFEDNKKTKYKFIVYDKEGKEVYQSKYNAKDVKIDGNKLTFYNIDKNKTEEVKLKK